jgi:hypothetical protein
MDILVLCHGKKLNNPSGTYCSTQLINIDKATFIDKDSKIKPHILQNLKTKFVLNKKYDIITTACCDGDVFYNSNTDAIVDQTFKNVKLHLKQNGVFIFPKYDWYNKHILLQIEKYFNLTKTIKKKTETLFIFKNNL